MICGCKKRENDLVRTRRGETSVLEYVHTQGAINGTTQVGSIYEEHLPRALRQAHEHASLRM